MGTCDRLCFDRASTKYLLYFNVAGLDPNVYQSVRRIDIAEDEEEITIDEAERFKSCDR